MQRLCLLIRRILPPACSGWLWGWMGGTGPAGGKSRHREEVSAAVSGHGVSQRVCCWCRGVCATSGPVCLHASLLCSCCCCLLPVFADRCEVLAAWAPALVMLPVLVFLLLALRFVRVLHPWLAGNRTASHCTACITKLTRHCDGSGPSFFPPNNASAPCAE